MVRLADTTPSLRHHLEHLECQTFPATPWSTGRPLAKRRIAIVSTAGLQKRGGRPFALGASDYRVIPGDTPGAEIVMSHISTNFDRSGYQQDLNVVFPIDRLREFATSGEIGSVADFHYSFMGATAPENMAAATRDLARLLQADEVDGVLLVPV
ncbi:MAG: selenoprotein B glycine/betaine/sarcosine/D-proline reductase [Gammaproteobacteria bacterium]|nr:selenoprotein B glycine/betaine/sarcosine/D-proline reductase [Gammaproteobacteria bacterium]